jgi:hypothetical protein
MDPASRLGLRLGLGSAFGSGFGSGSGDSAPTVPVVGGTTVGTSLGSATTEPPRCSDRSRVAAITTPPASSANASVAATSTIERRRPCPDLGAFGVCSDWVFMAFSLPEGVSAGALGAVRVPQLRRWCARGGGYHARECHARVA